MARPARPDAVEYCECLVVGEYVAVFGTDVPVDQAGEDESALLAYKLQKENVRRRRGV